MEITEVETIPISIPYSIDFDIAGGGTPTADHVLVKLHTDEGVVGIGEASPMPYFAPETMNGIISVLDDYLAPAIKGKDPLNFTAIHEELDTIEGNPFAKTAIDIACYDAAGKHLGVPVSTLLGGQFRDKIEVGQSIGIKETEQAVEDARMYVDDWGFNSIKVKVGNDPEADIERTKAIYDAVGDRVPVRVDANQGYRTDQAIRVFTKLEETCDLMFVEQPVSRTDLAGMARITDAISTPVLADETVFSHHDAIDVVRQEAADIISIKINKAGGLFRSKQIADIAAGAEMPLAIGSMVEMGVGTAAGAHFASTLPHAVYPSDVKGPSLHEASVLEEPIRIEDGYTHVPEGPGLGVSLDEGTITQFRAD